ncbi:hypothetical protein WN943_025024 [Citrus x changshan-huyou]
MSMLTLLYPFIASRFLRVISPMVCINAQRSFNLSIMHPCPSATSLISRRYLMIVDVLKIIAKVELHGYA